MSVCVCVCEGMLLCVCVCVCACVSRGVIQKHTRQAAKNNNHTRVAQKVSNDGNLTLPAVVGFSHISGNGVTPSIEETLANPDATRTIEAAR